MEVAYVPLVILPVDTASKDVSLSPNRSEQSNVNASNQRRKKEHVHLFHRRDNWISDMVLT